MRIAQIAPLFESVPPRLYGGTERVVSWLTEELVRRVCIMGEASEALAGLRAFVDAGADLPIVYPVATRDALSSILGTVFALAPHPEVE